MRILVCGSRTWTDSTPIAAMLRGLREYRLDSEFVIIHGAAPGADTIAGDWAVKHGVNWIAYPADWATHGRAAGPIRNRQMLEDGKPDYVLAFRSPGESKGTDNMINLARQHRIPTYVITVG